MITHMGQSLWTQKRIHFIAGILSIAGLVGAAWVGYSWYMRSKEQAAYKDLAESIDGYVKMRSGGDVGKWSDVERGFEAGAKRNPSSKLLPYFLAFQADALIEQGKLKEAIALMDKSVALIPHANPLYFLYAIKRALMKIDSTEDALQKQGRQELIALAKDTANPMQDMARYYSGLDALSQGDKAAAQSFFQEISARAASEKAAGDESMNVWYQMAQEKMRQL